jgi:hypothetical protein
MFYPAHITNLILLCRNCHSDYDQNYPGWFLLPTDLDFFIDFEKKDYAERVTAAEQGILQERALPQVLPPIFGSILLFIALIYR